MIERQNRSDTENLLRDTHARLEEVRLIKATLKSNETLLTEELERTKSALVMQTSLAENRLTRLNAMSNELTTLRREHDVLSDEKRAWSFSKLDLQAKTEEGKLVTQLRNKVAEVEDLSKQYIHELEETRKTSNNLSIQNVQLKVTLQKMNNDYTNNLNLINSSLTKEREKNISQLNKIHELNTLVCKYKTHKKVLVQELRARRKEQRSYSIDPEAQTKETEAVMVVEPVDNNTQKNSNDVESSDGGKSIKHVIVTGDNFNSLSIKYDMSISDIKRLNRLFGTLFFFFGQLQKKKKKILI